MNANRRISETNRVRVLLHHGVNRARRYGLCGRLARRLARYGVGQYRAGASVARAMRDVDALARACFFRPDLARV